MNSTHQVGVPEWLSGMTRNHVGFARAGSNPAAHVLYCSFHDCLLVDFRATLIGWDYAC